jgi:hypothetical protein
MSLNIITKETILEVSKSLIDIIKEEEKAQLKDMKMFLNKTNVSTEQKVKEYSAFSTGLFSAKVTACLQTAQQYIIEDNRLIQQKDVNKAQIDLTDAQRLVAIQEELIAKEKIELTKEQKNQVKEEINSIKTKTYLAIAETKVKLDNTVASTLSEARKNGAEVTSVDRTWIDPTTGISVDYQHISLAAASATDTTQGLIGMQMSQFKEQAGTFKDHSKVQVANQIMQLGSTAIADGMTNITGILTSHKQLCENIVGSDVFAGNYTSIG